MVIIFEQEGTVAVVQFPAGADPTVVAAGAVPAGTPWELIDWKELPPRREFRNAWQAEPGKVGTNMTKAREIHMGRIRTARNGKLKELDTEYQRADEDNDPALKAQIAQQKRELRDLPATFDLESAGTPEELSKLWPDDKIGPKRRMW